MTLNQLMDIYSKNKVYVFFEDNTGNYTSTLRDMSDKFINKGADFRKSFFTTLLVVGEVLTKDGVKYTLDLNTIVK